MITRPEKCLNSTRVKLRWALSPTHFTTFFSRIEVPFFHLLIKPTFIVINEYNFYITHNPISLSSPVLTRKLSLPIPLNFFTSLHFTLGLESGNLLWLCTLRDITKVKICKIEIEVQVEVLYYPQCEKWSFLISIFFNFFKGPVHVYNNTCIKKPLPGVRKDWQYPLTNVEKANTASEISFI